MSAKPPTHSADADTTTTPAQPQRVRNKAGYLVPIEQAQNEALMDLRDDLRRLRGHSENLPADLREIVTLLISAMSELGNAECEYLLAPAKPGSDRQSYEEAPLRAKPHAAKQI